MPEDLCNMAFTNKDNQDGNNDRDVHLGGPDDDAIIDGLTILANVELVQTMCEFLIIHLLL